MFREAEDLARTDTGQELREGSQGGREGFRIAPQRTISSALSALITLLQTMEFLLFLLGKICGFLFPVAGAVL